MPRRCRDSFGTRYCGDHYRELNAAIQAAASLRDMQIAVGYSQKELEKFGAALKYMTDHKVQMNKPRKITRIRLLFTS